MNKLVCGLGFFCFSFTLVLRRSSLQKTCLQMFGKKEESLLKFSKGCFDGSCWTDDLVNCLKKIAVLWCWIFFLGWPVFSSVLGCLRVLYNLFPFWLSDTFVSYRSVLGIHLLIKILSAVYFSVVRIISCFWYVVPRTIHALFLRSIWCPLSSKNFFVHSQECPLSHNIYGLFTDISWCLHSSFFSALSEAYLFLNLTDFKGEIAPLSNPREKEPVYAEWSGNAVTPVVCNLCENQG